MALAPAVVNWIFGWIDGHFLTAGLKQFLENPQRPAERLSSSTLISHQAEAGTPVAAGDRVSDRASDEKPVATDVVKRADPSGHKKARGEGKVLLFAYGSNMRSTRLQERAPSARAIGIGQLRAHALQWHKRSRDGSGKCDAELTGRQEDVVWGVLYEIDRGQKADIDRAEGLGHGYSEKEVEIDTADGAMKAQVYVATTIDRSLRPTVSYKAMVVAGAREQGLPADYVLRLESIQSIADPTTAKIAARVGS